MVAGSALAADAEPGFTPIFGGQDLAGWDGDPKFWRVDDGVITGQTTVENPTKANTFLIWRDGSVVDDFELRLDYKISGGNSGVQYRSVDKGQWVVTGYQADIDAGDTLSGALYDEGGRAILAQRGDKATVDDSHKPKVVGHVGDAAKLQAGIKKDDWNSYEIVAKGKHLVQKINGKVTADVVDNDVSARAASGVLALQLHSGAPMKVQFRNLRIKRTKLVGVKKVVFVAGGRSHNYGAHDLKAGCYLLADHLAASGLGIQTAIYYPGWPKDPTAFDNADAIVVYTDGGARHPIVPHLAQVAALAKKGVGIGFMHYGVEVEAGKPGDSFLDWTGGFFEANWSVNPFWTPTDMTLAKHPITNGVHPFSVNDEWYYHMRFRPKMQGVTAIVTAHPTAADTLIRPNGPHEGNPAVREAVAKNEPQHLMWARQRPDGGRGFGFTGGHGHWNWAQPDQRRLLLNAIVWLTKVNVPKGGVPTREVTMADLELNADEVPDPAKFDRAKTVELVNKMAHGN